MIEQPSQSSARGKGVIIDVYITISPGGTGYFVDDDDDDDDTESETDNEGSVNVVEGDDEKAGDVDEAAQDNLDDKSEEPPGSLQFQRRPPPRPQKAPRLPTRPAEVQGMHIHSPHLKKAIRLLITYYPGQVLTGEIIAVNSPFRVLFHCYHDLQRLLEEGKAKEDAGLEGTENKATEIEEAMERNHHLSVLLDYLKPKHLNLIKPTEDRFRDCVSSYDMLWLLYKPGCDVYGKVGGMLTGFVLGSAKEDSTRFRNPANGDDRWEHFWTIKAWHLNYTNGRFVRMSRSFKINKYDGEKDITTLPVFPCQYLDAFDGGKTRQNLENRGKIYFGYAQTVPVHLGYKGRAWDHRTY